MKDNNYIHFKRITKIYQKILILTLFGCELLKNFNTYFYLSK